MSLSGEKNQEEHLQNGNKTSQHVKCVLNYKISFM